MTIGDYINNDDPNISPVRLLSLYHLLTGVIAYDVPGDVVECGVFKGFSSTFLRTVMGSDARQLHLYDSFSGLPTPGEEDAHRSNFFQKGQFAISEGPTKVMRRFKRRGLIAPMIHVGTVEELLPKQLPSAIAFAHLDLDFVGPLRHALLSIYDRLSVGAVVVIDDYGLPELPDIAPAIDEIMTRFPEPFVPLNFTTLPGSVHGYFRKL